MGLLRLIDPLGLDSYGPVPARIFIAYLGSIHLGGMFDYERGILCWSSADVVGPESPKAGLMAQLLERRSRDTRTLAAGLPLSSSRGNAAKESASIGQLYWVSLYACYLRRAVQCPIQLVEVRRISKDSTFRPRSYDCQQGSIFVF